MAEIFHYHHHRHQPEEEDDNMGLHHQLSRLLVSAIVGDQTVERERVFRSPHSFTKSCSLMPSPIFLPILPEKWKPINQIAIFEFERAAAQTYFEKN